MAVVTLEAGGNVAGSPYGQPTTEDEFAQAIVNEVRRLAGPATVVWTYDATKHQLVATFS